MGCCLSSTTTIKKNSHHPKPHVTVTSQPPASLEEETVKEVLSETPISKPSTLHNDAQIPIVQQPKAEVPGLTNQKRKEDLQVKEETPEITQASEICSNATDTLSTATTATTTTTTVTEIREDEAMSKKRLIRSPLQAPRKRLYTEEREKVSRSPAKREKPVVRREFSSQTTTRTNQRNAGTRPRLTATRSAGGLGRGRVGGSPRKLSGRAASRSIGAGSTASGTKTEDGSDSILKEQQQRQQGNESLENPLVALECFIFL